MLPCDVDSSDGDSVFYSELPGGLWDGCFALFLGLVVGIFDVLSSRSSLFANCMEFIAALAVSFLARIFSIYFKSFQVCYYSMAISALVQLLPGTVRKL